MDSDLAGVGYRHRLQIGGENYYLIVDRGPDGPCINITCPRENAPENAQMRQILERVCVAATAMLRAL